MSYYGKAKNRPIIAPSGNANYPIVETNVDQLSKGKNLSGKTFKGAIAGMPNQMTGPDLIKFWPQRLFRIRRRRAGCDSHIRNVGIILALLAERRQSPVAREEHNIVAERPELFGN